MHSPDLPPPSPRVRRSPHTVGFHNFNLRISNFRVSNPSKLIVDVFLTRCRISMCQGLGPNKHDEISEIDRTSAAPRSLCASANRACRNSPRSTFVAKCGQHVATYGNMRQNISKCGCYNSYNSYYTYNNRYIRQHVRAESKTTTTTTIITTTILLLLLLISVQT